MKVLEVEGVSKSFPGMGKQALSGVSFCLQQGECLGIVGGSGSGKTTLAHIIMLLQRPDSGSVSLFGQEILGLSGKQRKRVYAQMQMVFQMPLESFDPSYSLGASIAEVGRSFGASRTEAKQRALEKLDLVGLDESFYRRFPTEASGGQCQRAALARALMAEPSVLVCDEIWLWPRGLPTGCWYSITVGWPSRDAPRKCLPTHKAPARRSWCARSAFSMAGASPWRAAAPLPFAMRSARCLSAAAEPVHRFREAERGIFCLSNYSIVVKSLP